ncbi:ATP-binding protein [Streptomyces pulveraceus]|uniref:ATP-binding protein n=1 Tax=Streptomyces pulveraceus TaxID=68258 RepID=A0ABW1GR37_9ACTN
MTTEQHTAADCRLPVPPPPQLVLDGVSGSVRAGRAYAHQFMSYHRPDAGPDHIDDVLLVVSELVTNAVRYGTEPGDFVLLTLDADADRTRIEVHDTARRRPRRKPESASRERGRGLLIVEALATWGLGERPMGKFVWAEVKAASAGSGAFPGR